MPIKNLPHYALASLLGILAPLAGAAENAPDAPTVVAAIEGAFGVTPGERRNHIKGVCAVGEFVGSKEAAAYSRSALFSGKDPRLPKASIVSFSLSAM